MIHSKALTFKKKYIITSFLSELTLYHTIPGSGSLLSLSEALSYGLLLLYD